MFLKSLNYAPLLLFLLARSIATETKEYSLEALCGTHTDLRVANVTSFTLRAGKETSPTCHGTLNVRWETQQAFWVTVTVRRFSFTRSSASVRDGACNTPQPIKLVSYDGIRSISGPTEFSMRFFSSVQLQYSRRIPFENSELDMTITVEPFEIEEKVEWFNRHNYHNVSLEDFCGQNLSENVSDGAVRWGLNVIPPPWKTDPDSKCLTALNFHAGNSPDPYFVSVGVHDSDLGSEADGSRRQCLSRHPLSIRGLNWIHTVTPGCSVLTLMRHSGITRVVYDRKEPYKETMYLNMTLRLNEGDYFVTDKEYDEEPPARE
ncbi:uncharacterized protein LOC100899822 [Galendromus occidentalis]|uniref:Uncharacterized protein LOC100899822 n=1 Tax=Galendromus occidentalis TaxID=34638 RepID=A0AAJ6QPY4_9ACAR|nr:uncharacterized protein LOC100899822 [Galendromus occidentalis]